MSRYIGVWILVAGLAGCGDDDVAMDAGGMDVGPCTSNAQCDDGVFCNGVEACESGTCIAGTAPCAAGETCDEGIEECSGACETPDADGDGHPALACGGDDCDDDDANRFPSNLEVCDPDGHDEDCNVETFGERDLDFDGFIDIACCNGDVCGTDCADALPDVGPGATEVCNLRDDDCDGNFDEGVSVALHPDMDGDLHGTAEALQSCPGFAGTSTSTIDCDDSNIARHGAQLEHCDGLDNDCDSITDEAVSPLAWYPDVDGDGFGTSTTPIVQCETPMNYSLLPTDCADGDVDVHPAATELCNALDDNCDGFAGYVIGPGDTEDDDGDGFADSTCGGDDCDDLDPLAYAGASELMDGVDNDCDGTVDENVVEIEWFLDADSDGLGGGGSIMSSMRQMGRVPMGGDCDDDDASRASTQREICDGIDNDCDGTVDEDTPMRAYFVDGDTDGYGHPGVPTFACEAPDGFADNPGDCNDGEALIFPGATELCDMVDNDCDLVTDEDAEAVAWYEDFDGDTWGTGPMLTMSCVPVAGQAPRAGDCADMNEDVFPGAMEVCNELNDDCDALTDEGVTTPFYLDQDEDGRGDAAVSQLACAAPPSYVDSDDDCDDADPNNYPTNDEVCDLTDNDCDMGVDEGFGVSTYKPDVDGDGFAADDAVSVDACVAPDGYTADFGDCDELSARAASVYPGATELCNGLQEDCATDIDGEVDEGTMYCGLDALYTGQCLPAPTAPGQCGCVDGDTGECDGDPTVACETDLAGDIENCGACGNACASNQSCSDGSCEDAPIVSITSGGTALCAVREGGVVQCWGNQQHLFPARQATAQTILSGYDVLDFATAVNPSVARNHSCFITPGPGGNDIYCYGYNANGQCGGGALGGTLLTPQRILPALDNVIHDWAQVVTSTTFSYARRANGEVYSWGGGTGGDSGQLGRAFTSPGDPVPQLVPVIDDAIDIDGDSHHACAVRGDSGEVWCWGGSSFGRTGDGRDSGPDGGPVSEPVVDATGGGGVAILDAVQVVLHTDGGCLRQNGGGVYCWGSPMGNGFGGFSYHAVPVSSLTNATDLACGRRNCCALTSVGTVQCWGTNANGEVGDDTQTTRLAPVAVRRASGSPLLGVRDITMSSVVSCALLATEEVACWGLGEDGQLGDNILTTHTRLNAGAPTPVIGL